MRIVLFGSGSPLSVAVFARLSGHHDVAATVVPTGANVRTNALACVARNSGPVLCFDASLPDRLRQIAPAVLCVATFSHKITAAHLQGSRFGGLNVHTSLLPRHRGPDPLFWTYFDNDADTGVTIHAISDEIDAGDIYAQTSIPLRRGRPVTDLYGELSRIAADSLLDVVDSLESGTSRRRPQGEPGVTIEPRPALGTFSIGFHDWGAERVWHFLSGIGDRRIDLLPMIHGPALGYEVVRHEEPAGRVVKLNGRIRVYCHDGFVEMARPSVARRARSLGRRLRERVRRLY